jgi:hypothetical protein
MSDTPATKTKKRVKKRVKTKNTKNTKKTKNTKNTKKVKNTKKTKNTKNTKSKSKVKKSALDINTLNVFAKKDGKDNSDFLKKENEFKHYASLLLSRGVITVNCYNYMCDMMDNNQRIINVSTFVNIFKLESSDKNVKELLQKIRRIAIDMYPNYFVLNSDGDLMLDDNIKTEMINVGTIKYTDDQSNALNTIYDFIVDSNRPMFCFQGYAGTGKTTTLVNLVSYLLCNGYIKSIAFTAPTNKALDVIKNAFKPHLTRIIQILNIKMPDTSEDFGFDDMTEYLELCDIKINFLTIHKLLQFKQEYSTMGEVIFVRADKTKSLISDYDLVMIDECSMIGLEMIDNIVREVKMMCECEYTKKPKLIFTGDPAQLPPVNEAESSIFCRTEEDLPFKTYMTLMGYGGYVSSDKTLHKKRYDILLQELSKIEIYLLKQVVRSRLSNVTAVCNEFRQMVSNEEYNMDILQESISDMFANGKITQECMKITGVTLYNYVDINKINTKWFKHFLRSIKKGETSIILTWTNRQTDIYNKEVRRQIFGKTKLNQFEVNDMLILAQHYSLNTDLVSTDMIRQKLNTSEQIKVAKVRSSARTLRVFEKMSSKTYKNHKHHKTIDPMMSDLIEYMNGEYCTKLNIKCWVMSVKRMTDNDDFIIVVVDEKSIEAFNKAKNHCQKLIKNFATRLLAKYKTGVKTIESCMIKPLWKQWRTIFVDPFAVVNYGYSITTHKSQGSSYYNCYVDLDDIMINEREVEGDKCAYTSVTRTSNELHILL